MSISFNDDAARIWKFLISNGMTDEGAAGMMGNLFAESGLKAMRLEDLCKQRYKERRGKVYTDSTYMAFVDDGTISREEFLRPMGLKYAWGLAQWTTPSRKAGLYDLCKQRGVSIADLQTQLDYLMYELENSYVSLLTTLKSTHDILAASNAVLTKFEQPADTGAAVRQIRYSYAKQVYDAFHQGGDDTGTETAISKVIGIAEQEIGYLEKKSNAYLDDKTANAGSTNITKYWDMLYPAYQGQPWCAIFISYLFYKAFGLETAKKLLQHWPFVYCPTLAAKTTNKTPVQGSVILFYRNGTYAHTGLVVSVNGNTITTIEGNTSGASGVIPNGGGVCKKSYGLSGLSAMTKYYVPDYSIVSEDTDMMYYVRSSWLDTGSQTFKGLDLSKAKASARKNKQLYVFDATGKIIWPVHKTVKARIERAVQWENAIQKDGRHGYSNTEAGRWGQKGDYACSSLQIIAYQQAGVPVKTKGATVTANMRDAFIAAGFRDVTDSVNFITAKGLRRGDVLLVPGKHTEMYIGAKRLIGARGNATGDGPENGKAGDQTGGEIVKSGYYNYPWTICLRYVGLPKNTRIQCGSFKQRSNAEKLVENLRRKFDCNAKVEKVDEWYVVRTPKLTREDAVALRKKMLAAGYEAALFDA